MKLVSSIAATMTLAVGLAVHASNMPRPPVPDWQTDPVSCAWQWKEGGGLGLWTETCRFPTGRWEVVWSEQAAAFILQVDGQAQQLVVQSWPYSKHGVRYFMTDSRWPDRAIFVDEGQERPLFDPFQACTGARLLRLWDLCFE